MDKFIVSVLQKVVWYSIGAVVVLTLVGYLLVRFVQESIPRQG